MGREGWVILLAKQFAQWSPTVVCLLPTRPDFGAFHNEVTIFSRGDILFVDLTHISTWSIKCWPRNCCETFSEVLSELRIETILVLRLTLTQIRKYITQLSTVTVSTQARKLIVEFPSRSPPTMNRTSRSTAATKLNFVNFATLRNIRIIRRPVPQTHIVDFPSRPRQVVTIGSSFSLYQLLFYRDPWMKAYGEATVESRIYSKQTKCEEQMNMALSHNHAARGEKEGNNRMII